MITVYEKFRKCCDRNQITDAMLEEASQLFSENYGIWGKEAAKAMNASAKVGSRVKISKDRLRAQCLPEGAACSYIRVTVDGHLAGNAFACHWTYNNISVCWVTQLLVHRDYRERGLAMGRLMQLKQDNDDVYGLMSSHAASCMAAEKIFGNTIGTVELDFIRGHAETIIATSPINYVKNAKLCGSLFNPEDTSGMISCADTGFFVDHTETHEALVWARTKGWPLGELGDGHEFFLILQVRRRSQSTSQLNSASYS